MHPVVRLPYASAGSLARIASRLAATFVPQAGAKTLRALVARHSVAGRYAAWARASRDPARPLVWLHAPSVGEALQARPLIDLLRARHPQLQLAFTFYSPSAESFAQSLDVDFADYLAFDTVSAADAAIDSLRPAALIFSKLDVWPLLAERATARGVKLALIAGTVSAESSRSGPLVSLLLRDAYAALDAVGAVDSYSAERLIGLGVRPGRITITGDTRADQVAERASRVDTAGALLLPLTNARPTLVAGSTWPSDEERLFDAWPAVRAQVPGARLIIAPHEPSEESVVGIERLARRATVTVARLGASGHGTADVVVVDRVGVLGDLYALATVAFVGGGFHTAGLHSVLEPAAFGIPVLFGPRHQTNRDGANLIACGGGASVQDSSALAARLVAWLSDSASREASGRLARAFVRSGVGAAGRTLGLIEALLPAGSAGSLLS